LLHTNPNCVATFALDKKNMKQLLLTNWNFFRVFRLLVGVAIMIEAFTMKDVAFGAAGLAFSLMAMFNTSCCGMNSCNTPIKKTASKIEDTTYEEIK
jgi:hypothetical protein